MVPIRVVFLGTSAGTPTKGRYLPAVVLVREGEMFLFDCGEGAQMRFRKAGLKFSRLSWILISHMHGDHVTGLMGLLMSLQMGERVEPLRLVGPAGLQDFVIGCKRLLRTDFSYPIEFIELSDRGGIIHDGDEFVIEAAALQHRVPTYGYALAEKDRPGTFDVAAAKALGVPPGPLYGRLQQGYTVAVGDGTVVRPDQVLGTAKPGRRIAYVSDTRPCRNAELLARGADLLVHEATFAGDMASEARHKKHCTVVEAAQTAAAAGAKRLVLTHFSPRYLDLEPLRREAAEVFSPVDVAADLLQLDV